MRYAIRRFLLAIPLVLSVTFVVFGMLKLIKGDPAQVILGTAYTPAAAARLTKEFGLDKPFLVQYLKWLGNLLRGDFGYSYGTDESVNSILARAFPVTVQVVILTMLITLAVSIPLGVYSAYRVGGFFDRIVTSAGFAFISMPGFLVGLLLLKFVSIPFEWPKGQYVPISEASNPFESWKYLVLPSISLSLGLIANYLRTLRTDMVSTLQEDFISLAKTKGLSDQRILWRHALRPSSITLTTVAGINFGTLIGGTLIAEQLFGLPGFGQLIFARILRRDYLVVLAIVAVVTVAFVLLTTIVDILYGVIDPRVRHARAIA
jgi:peptide/nickel transport system permease protein